MCPTVEQPLFSEYASILYRSCLGRIAESITSSKQQTGDPMIRRVIHGDCQGGNIDEKEEKMTMVVMTMLTMVLRKTLLVLIATT